MPDVLTFMFAPALFVISLLFITNGYNKSEARTGKVFLFLAIILSIWWIFYIKSDWRYIKETVTIQTAFDRDMFEYDGCIHNANNLFGKDFEDGQSIDIVVRDKGPYVGLVPVGPNVDKIFLNGEEQ